MLLSARGLRAQRAGWRASTRTSSSSTRLYGPAALADALDGASALASPATIVVIEHARRDAAPDSAGALVRTRELMSGDSALAFYRRASEQGAA